MSLSQQMEAGTELMLRVGKQIHILYIFHFIPNKHNLLFGPHVVLSLWFTDSSLALIWYRMTEVQWQSYVKKN